MFAASRRMRGGASASRGLAASVTGSRKFQNFATFSTVGPNGHGDGCPCCAAKAAAPGAVRTATHADTSNTLPAGGAGTSSSSLFPRLGNKPSLLSSARGRIGHTAGTTDLLLGSSHQHSTRAIASAATAAPNMAMKTLAKLHPETGIWMDEKPIPKPGYNDVLIQIKKTAICGTDVSIYKWTPWAQNTVPVGMTVGHEYAGEIVDMGEGVRSRGGLLQIGMRVSGEGHITCGVCRNCRAGRRHLCRNEHGVGVHIQGAFAEYLSLPAENVFPIPDSISDNVASCFDPLGNAVHTALSFNLVGEDVLVTGAGPIGIWGAMLAKRAGARRVVITDVNEYRLDLARSMPQIDRVVNVSKEDLRNVTFDELGLKEGYDVGLEMSGSAPAFRNMVELLNNGGNLALLGLVPDDTQIPSLVPGLVSETLNGYDDCNMRIFHPNRFMTIYDKLEHSLLPCSSLSSSILPLFILWSQLIFKGLVVKGVYGREMYETWYKMMALVDSGFDPTPVITHHYKLADYAEAFDKAVGSNSGKVILDWEGNTP
ncbi:unnamed protein product [Amoebophrya sp. A25]|nr:unnamed protein product [Amoebophrya sp. A25]|eukprot:GSA25T00001034001.1